MFRYINKRNKRMPILDFSSKIDKNVAQELGMTEYLMRVLELLDQEYGLKGKAIADIGGSNITPQIAQHYGIKKMVCIDPISKWFEDLNIDIKHTQYNSIPLLKNKDFLKAYNSMNYFVIDECAENLSDDYFKKFDLIVSMSTFEHVSSITETMNNIYKMLKINGVMFSTYEPIFSCAQGHHLWINDSLNFTNTPELNFFHLKYTYEEANDYLEKFDRFREFKKQILDMVYKSNVINRKTFNQHIEEISNSMFSMYQLHYWNMSNSPDTDEIIILESKYGKQKYDVRGIAVIGYK